jgi:hypothetical protein
MAFKEEEAARLKFNLLGVIDEYIQALEKTKESVNLFLAPSSEIREIVTLQQVNESATFRRYQQAKEAFLNLLR